MCAWSVLRARRIPLAALMCFKLRMVSSAGPRRFTSGLNDCWSTMCNCSTSMVAILCRGHGVFSRNNCGRPPVVSHMCPVLCGGSWLQDHPAHQLRVLAHIHGLFFRFYGFITVWLTCWSIRAFVVTNNLGTFVAWPLNLAFLIPRGNWESDEKNSH